ncbi:MAG TPA: hydrogenase maturation nickel metallochaperone HypA [Gaiellales bacterium]|nr:hydrogenase maturation nickel metallochaperone HypA [Gaiellales bacterium]
MHELAIAQAIADVAAAHARGRRVVRVEVRVGHLRQVVPDALAFAFELVVQGTAADGAELALEEVRPGGRCRACGRDGALEALPLACPACGSFDVDLQRGEELLVDAIEIEESEEETAMGEAVARS